MGCSEHTVRRTNTKNILERQCIPQTSLFFCICVGLLECMKKHDIEIDPGARGQTSWTKPLIQPAMRSSNFPAVLVK